MTMGASAPTSSPGTSSSSSASPSSSQSSSSSSSLPSAQLVHHIRDTLSLLQNRLASAPELQLLVKSIRLSQERLGERVAAYEGLLPRLRSVVARQRQELASSAELLRQARQAYLETQYRLKLRQHELHSSRRGSDGSAAGGGDAAWVSVAVQTDAGGSGDMGRRGSSAPADTADGAVGRATRTTAGTASTAAATAAAAVAAAQAEAASLRQQLRGAQEQVRLVEDISRRRGGQLEAWRRQAEFQAGVNERLRHVIETQEEIIRGTGGGGRGNGGGKGSGRAGSAAAGGGERRWNARVDRVPSGAGSSGRESAAAERRHTKGRRGYDLLRDGDQDDASDGDEGGGGRAGTGSGDDLDGGDLEDIDEATEEEEGGGDDGEDDDDDSDPASFALSHRDRSRSNRGASAAEQARGQHHGPDSAALRWPAVAPLPSPRPSSSPSSSSPPSSSSWLSRSAATGAPPTRPPRSPPGRGGGAAYRSHDAGAGACEDGDPYSLVS